MYPIRTAEMKHTLFGEEGSDIEPLPALVEGDYRTSTVWETSDEEREQLAEGAQVGLIVLAYPTPPVALMIAAPYCDCGGRMQWNSRLRTYTCEHFPEKEGVT